VFAAILTDYRCMLLAAQIEWSPETFFFTAGGDDR
jgi:hypothetical protein